MGWMGWMGWTGWEVLGGPQAVGLVGPLRVGPHERLTTCEHRNRSWRCLRGA